MKTITKFATGALVACGLAVAAAAPAEAGVHVGIGIGLPVVAPVAPAAPTCFDAYGNPYYCGYPGYAVPGVVVGVGGWYDAHHIWHRGFRR